MNVTNVVIAATGVVITCGIIYAMTITGFDKTQTVSTGFVVAAILGAGMWPWERRRT